MRSRLFLCSWESSSSDALQHWPSPFHLLITGPGGCEKQGAVVRSIRKEMMRVCIVDFMVPPQ
jgi:hypothetical protein